MDQIFNSMLRGFGWALGRRAASRVPLWLGIGVIIAWQVLKHG